jgi:hypothetical protein
MVESISASHDKRIVDGAQCAVCASSYELRAATYEPPANLNPLV